MRAQFACVTAALAAGFLLAAATLALTSRPALATPAIAQKTGKPCTQCHTVPPKLNAYGEKYKKEHEKK